MSRKDYVAVAEVLRAEYGLTNTQREEVIVENIVGSLADKFAFDNPAFDRFRFYEAALGRDSLRPTVTGRA